MKFIIIVVLVFLFFTAFIFADSVNDLSNKKIIYLHKNNFNSPRVLAGVANIRYKNLDFEWITDNLFDRFSISKPNLDYKILDTWLNAKRCISSQIERFNTYSFAQQNMILELEDKLKRSYIIEFSDTIDVLEFCNYLLSKYSDIEIAEPYYISEPCAISNDPRVSEQKMLSTIQAFEGWDINEGDTNIVIGISDSGVNIYHEDLFDGVVTNEDEIPGNRIDDDNNGYIDDYYGYNFSWLVDGGENEYGSVANNNFLHGTYVAGMSAARTNNGKGIAGVANKCKILPIKICPTNSDYYLYCYQSIIYSAVRGCKVLNCSWGAVNAYSVICQSIVDYAVECDVAIVAAAGNLQGVINDPYAIYYPANYFGVLGVGAISSIDYMDFSSSIIGPSLRALAPGISNISTGRENLYLTTTYGSSYAAPIASGVVAILRSYIPTLSPLQSLEIVRMSGEDIKEYNSNNKFLTNRVNMLKSLQFDYTKSPAIILKSKHYENTGGEKTERFFAGDTAVIALNLVNVLADAKNVNVSLERLSALDANSYTLLDSIGSIDIFNTMSEKTIKFRFIVNTPANIRRTYYLVHLTSDNYNDNFKFNLSIYNNLTTFENDSLIVSISDKGVFGANRLSSNEVYGYGFEHKRLGDFLYEGGIVAAAEYQKSIGSCTDINTNDYSSFKVIKGLYNEDYHTSIVVDSATSANNIIGLEITSTYSFPTDTASALRIKLSAKNISGKKINDFVLGHYYDWDVNNPRYNETGYFPEAIPESITSDYAAAEYITDEHKSVYVGSLVYLNKDKYSDVNVIPQAMGLEPKEIYTSYSNQAELMTSGITHQKSEQGDRLYIVGLHLTDEFLSNAEFECTICTGVAKTKSDLADILINCCLSDITDIVDINPQNEVNVFWTDNELIIQTDADKVHYQVNIYNLLGNKIEYIETKSRITKVDLSKYTTGLYFISISDSSGKFYFNKFIR